MAISDRIQAMYTHTSDIYDSVELTGVDTTDIDKNLVNVPNTLKEGYIDIINNGTDTLYNNFPKVSGEGTSLTLNNTYQAPMRNNLKGNTSQTGTPTPTSPIPVNVVSGDNEITIIGKNLFDSANLTNVYKDSNANYSLITNGIRITQTTGRYNCCYFEIGDLSRYSGKTITLSLSADVSGGGSKRIAIAKSNTAYTTRTIIRDSTSNNSISLEVPQEDNTYTKLLLGLWVTTNTTQGNVYVDYTNIMLELGSSASTYEPYQSNTYNIDLPSGIELCKIGNYQDRIFKSSGKNLFNANEVQIGMAWNNTNNSARAVIIIPVEQNIAYTISMSGNNSMEGIYVSYSAKTLAENATNGVGLSLITSFPRTYTSSTEYIILQFNKSSISLSDIENLKLQVEEGTTATTYEPYGVGKWYLHKEIGKVVLNGSESGWVKANTTNVDRFLLNTSLYLNNSDSKCNLFKKGGIVNDVGIWFNNVNVQLGFNYSTYGTTTLEQWKTFLSNNNLILYQPLATPTSTEITDTTLINQLEELYIAKSKENQTNISQINNDLPFIISASALKKG